MVSPRCALRLSNSDNCLCSERQHRQLMKRHFASAGTTSGVLKALALLVESGCIYSALLVVLSLASGLRKSLTKSTQIFVLIYQAQPPPTQVTGPGSARFIEVAAQFTYGCLVPVVVSLIPGSCTRYAVTHCIPDSPGDLSHYHHRSGRSQTVAYRYRRVIACPPGI